MCCGTRMGPWRRGRATPSNVPAGTGWRQSFESRPAIDRYFFVHRVRECRISPRIHSRSPWIQGVTCAGCAAGRSEMWRMRGGSWHRYLHSSKPRVRPGRAPTGLLCVIVQPRAGTAERLAACPRQALTMMRVPPILTTGIVMADRGAWKVPGLNDPTGCALDPSSLGHF